MDYKECEKMASLALMSKKKPLTDENIGIVIGFILRANNKYNPKIGNEFGFRKMYIDFAIKTISTNRKKAFLDKTKYLPDYSNISEKASYKDFNDNLFWEDLKIKLTEREFKVIFSRIQDNKTLKEIGVDMGFSHETTRNILKSAYGKLKKCYV